MKTRLPAFAGHALGILYSLALMLFLLLPLLTILPASLGSAELIEFPPRQPTLAWYGEVLNDRDWLDSALLSLRIALGCAVLSTLLGGLSALYAYRYRHLPRGLDSLFTLPLWMPQVILASGLFSLLLPWDLLGSEVMLVLANTALALPLSALVLGGTFARIDPSLWLAASSLGARPLTILRTLMLPLTALGLFTSVLLAFHSAWDETVFALFIGPLETPTLTSRLYAYLAQSVTPAVAAVASLLVFATLLIALATMLLRRRSATAPHWLHS
ncbi:hypothetical protein DNJ95_16385 [Stutzerimonas kirkiae]|uniref:ABC transmembrane type-1 domain-containing protein n=1 Tax=Stutzerimonas kirkiae TaxID=2211392 RepID=A0A4Q9QYH5_9GAMM|nr:ABC transporter permease subunit [Stutzerimonas kirkiae]TBU90350.1 hypothetical protein DNJ96_16875 [Stutzerimonas kirkiae]TBU99585.1 hypothetical protein DNJ95_16385 [Stutzerimonas kirkiae]